MGRDSDSEVVCPTAAIHASNGAAEGGPGGAVTSRIDHLDEHLTDWLDF
jgi:hypothetical protein